MEEQIARFLIRAAKFEFYLVYSDRSLAQTREIAGLAVMTGVNWPLLAHKLEAVEPFGDYDFGTSPFGIFRETVPQFLVLTAESQLSWDSEEVAINSWAILLTRGYSQLRNNIAHGNKAFPPAPFTASRTMKFIDAGNSLLDFIANTLFQDPYWESPLLFR